MRGLAVDDDAAVTRVRAFGDAACVRRAVVFRHGVEVAASAAFHADLERELANRR